MSTYTHLSGSADLNSWLAVPSSITVDYQNSSSTTVISGVTRVIGSGLVFNQFGITAGRVDRLEYVDPSTKSVTQVISGISMVISTSGSTSGIGFADLFYGTAVNHPTYSHFFFGALTGNDVLQGYDGAESLKGLAGSDTIYGNGGNDDIFGDVQNLNLPEKFGNDVIYGGAGNDRIWAGRGNDFVDGGDGNDLIVGNDMFPTYAGYENYQYITGRDTLSGGAGNDLIYAQLDGSKTNTTENFYSYVGGVNADGGAGFDRLFVNLSHVSSDIILDWRTSSTNNQIADASSIVNIEELAIITGSGNDTIYDGAYMDQISTGAGNDTLYYGGTQLLPRDGFGYFGASIHLGSGDDSLIVNNVALGYSDGSIPPIDGGDGFDQAIVDYTGSITSRNFSAANLLNLESINYTGGGAADNVIGTAGADIINGGAGSDLLNGGGGNDLIIGGEDADQLNGGDGYDYAHFANSTAVNVDLNTGIGAGGEAAGDTYISIEAVIGSEFGDTITGSASGNELLGGGGDDMLEGLAGADFLSGGAGNDTASYLSSDAAVNVSLAVQAGAYGHAAGDVLVGIENLYGSGRDDMLAGDAGANLLFGAAGFDNLQGGAGDDVLIGGEGGDILVGGAGTDVFLFRPERAGSGDLVLDFDQNGDDYILFQGFGTGFAATVQAAALNSTDVIVYSAAWDSHVVLQNGVGRVDVSDFLFA
jgi:Ca2+-binding RTX toxin-like protein